MKWDIQEFISNFTETHREQDIGDNIAIFYKESNNAIKINERIEFHLKYFKGSYCTYGLDENTLKDTIPIEMIAIEEYSDSPYSIYIDENGLVDTYEFENISSIEIGGYALEIKCNHVVDYYIIDTY